MVSLVKGRSVLELEWQNYLSWWAWLCCSLSLAFIQSIPTMPAVVFVSVAVLYGVLFPLRVYRAVLWDFLPWMMPLWGAISVIWSDQPVLSLRAAVQTGITTLVGIMFAQALQARAFVAVVMYSLLASLLASLYISGIFGAKNSLAFAIALLILSSCWVMLDSKQVKFNRIVALLAAASTPPMLVAAGSEGALLTGGLALVCSFVPFLLRPLPPDARSWAIMLGLFVFSAVLVVAFWSYNDLLDVLLLSIGKDTTLTGRTMLWSYAAGFIADHPFGVGQQAFWVEGNRAAERFWALFGIYTRTGFHFHNLWLEIGVELGVPGILIAALTTFVIFFKVLQWVLRDPRPESCFFTGLVIFMIWRTIGEAELYSQFNLAFIIFIASYYYARPLLTEPGSSAQIARQNNANCGEN
jgi:exopolysaccharide production protein ExoQ